MTRNDHYRTRHSACLLYRKFPQRNSFWCVFGLLSTPSKREIWFIFRLGVQLILCIESIHYLKQRPGGLTAFYIAFSLVLVFLNAVQLAANTLYGQFMWIEQGPNTPGGPFAYFENNTTWWVNTLGTAASLAGDIASQALLVSHMIRCIRSTEIGRAHV